MGAVTFNPELFAIVNDLAKISNTIVFSKSNDGSKVKCWMRTIESNIAFTVDAPIAYFNFPTDTFAIYNYIEFYKYFNSLNVLSLEINDQQIYFNSEKSRLEYLLTDAKVLNPKTILDKVSMGDIDATFELPREDLDNIIKMNSLISAKFVRFMGNKDEVKLRVYVDQFSNTYEKTVSIKNVSNFTNDYDFSIISDTFNLLPHKRSYNVDFKIGGFVRFTFDKDDIMVNLYVGKVV